VVVLTCRNSLRGSKPRVSSIRIKQLTVDDIRWFEERCLAIRIVLEACAAGIPATFYLDRYLTEVCLSRMLWAPTIPALSELLFWLARFGSVICLSS